MATSKKRFYEAFLDGYKPAIVLESTSKQYDRVKNYPNVFPYDEKPILGYFFQTEELKSQFEREIKDIQMNSIDDHLIVGKILGFPQNSVNYFTHMRELEEKQGRYPTEHEEPLKVGVNWAGFEFASYLPIVCGDIGWLWGNYNHPKANGIPLYLLTRETGYLKVPYGDFIKLKEVFDYIMDKRGQTAVASV